MIRGASVVAKAQVSVAPCGRDTRSLQEAHVFELGLLRGCCAPGVTWQVTLHGAQLQGTAPCSWACSGLGPRVCPGQSQPLSNINGDINNVTAAHTHGAPTTCRGSSKSEAHIPNSFFPQTHQNAHPAKWRYPACFTVCCISHAQGSDWHTEGAQ